MFVLEGSQKVKLVSPKRDTSLPDHIPEHIQISLWNFPTDSDTLLVGQRFSKATISPYCLTSLPWLYCVHWERYAGYQVMPISCSITKQGALDIFFIVFFSSLLKMAPLEWNWGHAVLGLAHILSQFKWMAGKALKWSRGWHSDEKMCQVDNRRREQSKGFIQDICMSMFIFELTFFLFTWA